MHLLLNHLTPLQHHLKSCKRAHPVAQELCAAHESPHKPQERLPVHSNSRFQQIRGERCAPSFPSFRVARSSFSVACGLHNIGWVPGSAAASTRGTWLGRARRPSISICNSTSAAQPTSCSGKLHHSTASGQVSIQYSPLPSRNSAPVARPTEPGQASSRHRAAGILLFEAATTSRVSFNALQTH